MTASTHMRYMCWSTIRGAPCADQSRTNTILDAAELPTCGYHHAHRKPQPEIEKNTVGLYLAENWSPFHLFGGS